MNIVEIIESSKAQDGRTYYKQPHLEENQYIMARLKRSKGFIRPTNGKPYTSKDIQFFNCLDENSIELVIMEKQNDR